VGLTDFSTKMDELIRVIRLEFEKTFLFKVMMSIIECLARIK